jgi:arylsulfatase A-like enzyme
MRRIRNLTPLALICAGIAAVAIAVGADLVLGRHPGFGVKQLVLLLVGVGLMAFGGLLALGVGRSDGRPWRIGPRAHDEPMGPLELGLLFGLLTGLGEVVAYGAKTLTNETVRQSAHIVWMAPLADLVLFGGLGLLLTPIGRVRWFAAHSRILTFIFASLSAFSILLLFPKIEALASLALALGLAWQVSGLLTTRSSSMRAVFRSLLAWPSFLRHAISRRVVKKQSPEWDPGRRDLFVGAGATLATLALGTNAWTRFATFGAQSPRPMGDPGAPNVLFIVLDTVRAQSLSLYGYPRRTSDTIDRLAARGVTFDWAIAPAPWTLPSHASMFTGRYPHELSNDAMLWYGAPNLTLAEALGAEGYATAGFSANLNFVSRVSGITRGFTSFDDFTVTTGSLIQSSTLAREALKNPTIWNACGQPRLARKSAEDINRAFLGWQQSNGSRPFFAFLNYYDAHNPYQSPPESYLKFTSKKPLVDYDVTRADELSPYEIDELNDAYDSAIEYLDRQLGVLFSELDRRGVLQRTLLIVTSDHGEQFGEHGLMNHINSLYLPILRVPLVLRFPGHLPEGARVSAPVSLRSLPATVVNLLGLDGRIQFPGDSLARYAANNAAAATSSSEPLLAEVRAGECGGFPSWYPARRGSMRSLTWSSLHYIKHYGDGREELYDFAHDPDERNNLLADPKYRPELEWLQSRLATYRNI